MTSGERRETRIIRCPSCQRYYRISAGPPAPGTRLRCTKCGEVFLLADAAAAAVPPAAPVAAAAPPAGPNPAPQPLPAARPAPPGRPVTASGPRVLVATDGVEFQTLIDEVLAAAGYALLPVRSGEEAWEAIRSWRPHVALLDVALPGAPAFELCDRVRSQRELQGTGLILIASVFQQTRYKRAPTSLYGADDYIEKHHIRDWLPDKIARLLPAGTAPGAGSAPAAPPASPRADAAQAAEPAVIDEREKQTLIREELYGSRGREHQGLERLRENLRRYARIIISDIALYNQELVERGIREGTFTELLKKELDEGHRLYLTRVPPSAGGPDHYREAVQDFIAKRAGAPGAARPRRRGEG